MIGELNLIVILTFIYIPPMIKILIFNPYTSEQTDYEI